MIAAIYARKSTKQHVADDHKSVTHTSRAALAKRHRRARVLRFIIMSRLVPVLAITVQALGCSGGPIGPRGIPSKLSLGGTWTGTVADSQAGNGTITISMSQDHSALDGSWGTTSPIPMPFPQVSETARGALQGEVNAYAAVFTLTPQSYSPATVCFLAVAAGVELNQRHMSGTYTYIGYPGGPPGGCRVTATGTIVLNKS